MGSSLIRFVKLAVVLLCAAGMQAQTPAPAPASPAAAPVVAGEIRGTVKSGSTPLPGVSVSATNTLTGKKALTSTDVQGAYVLPVTGRGRYVIKVEFPAFAAVTKEAVINATTPNAQVDVELVLLSRVPKTAPGQAASTDVVTQALANVLNGQRSQSLSLSSTGAAVEGGTSDAPTENAPALANTADAGNDSVSIAGAGGRTQDFGRDIEDIRDRIEEMRARGDLPQGLGGMGGPGMFGGGPGGPGGGGGGRGGRGGGGFGRGFNINRPHGSIFYSMGNSVLDASPYSLNGPEDKPEYASNRFGATIGGPLKIPHVFDAGPKTFFFFNMFGTRSTQPYQAFSHVPTELERSGDFSQSVLANGQPVQFIDPLTGLMTNKLSPGEISSTAAQLLKYYPLPNQTGRQNFRLIDSTENNGTTIAFRINRSFGSSATTGRRGGGLAGLLGRNSVNFGLNYNSNGSDLLHPFPSVSGKTHSKGWNANAGYTFSKGKWTNNLRASFNRSRSETINLYSGITNIEGLLGIAGVSQDPFDWGLPGISLSNFTGLSDINPSNRRDDTLQIGDNVIWNHGKHNFRFGADYRHQTTAVQTNSNPRGSFIFTGALTGYDFADFLLGVPQQTSIQDSAQPYGFAANSWDLFVNDDWRIGGSFTVQLGLRYEYQGPYTESHNQLVNLDANPTFTSVTPVLPDQTGPFHGVYPASLVNPDRNNWAPRIGIAWKPFNKTVVRAGYGINYNLGQYRSIVQQLAYQPPFSFTQTNILSATNPLTIQNGFPVVTNTVTNNYGVDPNYRLGYVQLWNLNIQRELKWNLLLNVGYSGSKGTGLDIVRAPNRGPSGLLVAGVQPFLWESSEGSSIMHAGNVRLRKRLTKGMAFGATYTFSKSIDNASSIGGGATVVAQNDLDLAAERGLSSFDQRHKLTGDYTIELPFGEGRKWLTRPGAAEHILGDWTLNSTFSIASGFPYTARVLGNVADVGRGTNGTLRADTTGQSISLANPSIGEWFNTAAFVIPPTGQFGDAGRNTIIGPRTVNFNMSLAKSFQFKDTMNMEVRADASNVFNTPQFTSIDTVVNSPTFGQVVGVGAPRRIQFSLRYRF